MIQKPLAQRSRTVPSSIAAVWEPVSPCFLAPASWELSRATAPGHGRIISCRRCCYTDPAAVVPGQSSQDPPTSCCGGHLSMWEAAALGSQLLWSSVALGECETAIPAFSFLSLQDLIFIVIDSDLLSSRSCLILLIGEVSALNLSHLSPPCHDYTGAMLPPIFLSFRGIPSPCSSCCSVTDSCSTLSVLVLGILSAHHRAAWCGRCKFNIQDSSAWYHLPSLSQLCLGESSHHTLAAGGLRCGGEVWTSLPLSILCPGKNPTEWAGKFQLVLWAWGQADITSENEPWKTAAGWVPAFNIFKFFLTFPCLLSNIAFLVAVCLLL